MVNGLKASTCNPLTQSSMWTLYFFTPGPLTFKALSNTLQINGRAYLWNADHNNVRMTGTEDMGHFLFTCKTLQDIRVAEN